MKVTLVIGAIVVGGAERVLSILANYWATHDWDVTLITLADADAIPFYPIKSKVKLIQLGVSGSSPNLIAAIKNGLRRVKVLKTAIIASDPDVVISFMETANVLTLLACWNTKIPTIVSERVYPGYTYANRFWKVLTAWTYRRANSIVLLTQNSIPFFPASRGYRPIVIPNPVNQAVMPTITAQLLPKPSLLAVGRLHPQKGFDLLIKAFAQIHAKHPDWQLTILGEGSMRSELEELRAGLKLTDCVYLPGKVSNVSEYLHQADIFVMPSRFEGFPNALGEAMAYGLPAISCDCLSGPSDLINPGIDGILIPVEDVDALATAIDDLIANPDKRQRLAQAAPQILERFGLEQVMEMWSGAVLRVANPTSKRKQHRKF
jgi:GalNAc-alpha-(1->4)-GalNAc-alpha-(1->3)-diNAcBac-PP-undecaprenol alpha-1,4-N-acetyl-D-galactosaminyltransferase